MGNLSIHDLKNGGSKKYRPTVSKTERQTDDPSGSPTKLSGIINVFRRWGLGRKIGETERSIADNQVSNQERVARHQDDAAAETNQFDIDIRKTVNDREIELRAQKFLRSCNVYDEISAINSVDVLVRTVDAKIRLFNDLIDDPVLCRQAIAQIRNMASVEMIRINEERSGGRFGQ